MDADGFDVLYEEGPCLVVCKPAGLLTQAPQKIDSLEVRVRRFLMQRDGKAYDAYLSVVHRLDRPVSGALLMATTPRATRRLSEQIQARTVDKVYWALLEGQLDAEEGEWVDYVRKIPNQARSEVVDQAHPEGRIAVLRFRLLEQTSTCAWVEIRLETGRTHQIRVQSAWHGHNVVGDVLYGAHQLFGPDCDHIRDRWIALHARSLAFVHPVTREPRKITAPLPTHWRQAPDGIVAAMERECG